MAGQAPSGPPRAVQALEERLSRLPSIGKVTARRLAYHLLRVPEGEAEDLARAILQVRQEVRPCTICGNLGATDPCWICADPGRDRSCLCVVEDARDLLALEKAGVFQGLYHVLPARLAPLQGMGPEALEMERLLARIDPAEVGEVILATNPDQEGEATARLLAGKIQAAGVRVSRIARGIPAGASIEQVQAPILEDAFLGRRTLDR
jgi:recombination protein RecR